jgi:Gluconate 2-dehydrogenase subunit 3
MAEPPLRPTRRTILKSTVVSALVGAALGAVAFVRTRGYPSPSGRTLRSLAPWEARVFEHAARRIAAPDRTGDPRIPSADDVDVVGFIDGYTARMSAPMRRDLSRALLYLEQLAPLAVWKRARFTELSADDQDHVLESLETSPVMLLRGAFNGIKSLVFMGYYRDARTWPIVSYDGPWLGRPSKAPRP